VFPVFNDTVVGNEVIFCTFFLFFSPDFFDILKHFSLMTTSTH